MAPVLKKILGVIEPQTKWSFSALAKKYNESGGIPDLEIFDEAGNNLTIDGYADVASQFKEDDDDEEDPEEPESEASKCKSAKEVVALWRSKAKH